MDDKVRNKFSISDEHGNINESDVLDEYIDTVGNVHAPVQLKNNVMNMAYKKRGVSIRLKGMAVVAATVIVMCLCFHTQIMAFAQSISYKSKHTYVIGKNSKKEFSSDMGYVQVNALTSDDFKHSYSTIEDVEKLMGVTFLKSDDAYIAPVTNIRLERNVGQYDSLVTYRITDGGYYVNNMELMEAGENGELWYSITDDAYRIGYEAVIHNDYNMQEGEETIFNYNYNEGVYVEEYETQGGYKADIFIAGNEYEAVIFDNSIMYSFRAYGLGTINKLDVFKKFLDTLKY